MPLAVLTLWKLALLGLLYLFLARVVRVVLADLYGQRRRAKPRQRAAVAPTPAPRKVRRQPRELVVHPPNGSSVVVTLNGDSITLGRSGAASIRVDDVFVSDEHTQVISSDDGWMVRDLGSTNGTFLNGVKVTQPTLIGHGDHLRLGKTRVEVRR